MNPEEPAASSTTAPKSKVRRVLRRTFFGGAVLAGLLLLAFFVSVLTFDKWFPPRLTRYIQEELNLYFSFKTLHVTGLHGVAIEEMKIGLPEQEAALELGKGAIRFNRGIDLFQGRIGAVKLERLTLRDQALLDLKDRLLEVAEEKGWLKDKPQKDPKKPLITQVHNLLKRFGPQKFELNDAKMVLHEGGQVALDRLYMKQEPGERGGLLLEAGLKTRPLLNLPFLALSHSLETRARLSLTSQTARLKGVETRLGNLMQLQVAEMDAPFRLEETSLDLSGSRMDMEAFLSQQGYSLPGEYDLQAQLKSLRYGLSQEPRYWTGDLAPAWFSEETLTVQTSQWKNPLPGYALKDLEKRVHLQIAGKTDFQEIWTRLQGSGRLAEMETPFGHFPDFRMNSTLEARYFPDRIVYGQEVFFLGPYSEKENPPFPRMRMKAQSQTQTDLHLQKVQTRFNVKGNLEKANAPDLPFAVEALTTSGWRAEQKRAALQADLKTSLSKLTVQSRLEALVHAETRQGQLQGTHQFNGLSLELLEWPERYGLSQIPLGGTGEGRGNFQWKVDTQGPAKAKGSLEFENFSPRFHKRPLLTRPVSLRGGIEMEGDWTKPGQTRLPLLEMELEDTLSWKGRAQMESLKPLAGSLSGSGRLAGIAEIGKLLGLPLPGLANLVGLQLELNRLNWTLDQKNRSAEVDLELQVAGWKPGPFALKTLGNEYRLNTSRLKQLFLTGTVKGKDDGKNLSAHFEGESRLTEMAVLLLDPASTGLFSTLSLTLADFSCPVNFEADLKNRRQAEARYTLSPRFSSFLVQAAPYAIAAESGSWAISGQAAFTLPGSPTDSAPFALEAETNLAPTSFSLQVFAPAIGLLPPLKTRVALKAKSQLQGNLPGGLESLRVERTALTADLPGLGRFEERGKTILQLANTTSPSLDTEHQFHFHIPQTQTFLDTVLHTLEQTTTTLSDRPTTVTRMLRSLVERLELTSGVMTLSDAAFFLNKDGCGLKGVVDLHIPAGSMKNPAGSELLLWKSASAHVRFERRAPNLMALLSPQNLETIQLEGDFAVEESLAAGLKASQVHGRFHTEDEKLVLSSFAFQSYKGQGYVYGEAELRDFPSTVTVQAEMDHVDLQTFTEEYDMKNVKMNGVVSVQLEGRKGLDDYFFKVDVKQESARVELDRATAFALLVGYPKKLGTSLLFLGSETSFHRNFGDKTMVGFDQFDLDCRYVPENEQFANRLLMVNEIFNLTLTTTADLPDVLAMIRHKQKLLSRQWDEE